MSTSPTYGRFMVRGEGSIVQSRASCATFQARSKHLSWRLEPEVVWCRHGSIKPGRKFNARRLVVVASRQDAQQNLDLPTVVPKSKRKPPLLPKQTSRRKLPNIWEDPSLKPPANGLLVKGLIPVAHEVMDAKATVTKGVGLLLEELPVFACRYCTETHVASVGHNLRTCTGPGSSSRNSRHDWVKGSSSDILVPIDAYHLADRLAHPVSHEERFEVERIPAVDELCIQAGIEIPEHPTKRYSEPVQALTRRRRQDAGWLGGVQFTYYTSEGSYLYRDGSKQTPHEQKSKLGLDYVEDKQVDDSPEFRSVSNPSTEQSHEERNRGGPDDAVHTHIDASRQVQTVRNDAIDEHLRDGSKDSSSENLREPLAEINSADDLQSIAQKTLDAWERMQSGCKQLMVQYRVLACGYCPEVHVGPRGHKGRNCGEFKHQWRDGKHGWQDAALNDLIPPQYVWHVRDRLGPPLDNSLRRYYGKAPAIVELCVQAGAPIPQNHAALMRLDIAIPSLEETRNVI